MSTRHDGTQRYLCTEGTGIDLDEVADDENPVLAATTARPPAALLALEDERMGEGNGGKMGSEAAAYKVTCS